MRVLLFWTGVLLFTLTGQFIEGGHIGSLIQGTAAIIVFGPILTYLFFQFGFKGFFAFWGRLLRHNLTIQDGQILDQTGLIGFLAGAIGCFFGMIHVMENLTNTSKLGAGIAVSFVSSLYGIMPALFLCPLVNMKNSEQLQTSRNINRKAAGFYGAFVFLLLFGLFFVVLFATSSRQTQNSQASASTLPISPHISNLVNIAPIETNLTYPAGHLIRIKMSLEWKQRSESVPFSPETSAQGPRLEHRTKVYHFIS